MSTYPPITDASDQQLAADALATLERIRDALGVAVDESRSAAAATPAPRLAQALEELSEMLMDAAADAGLDRHIRSVDAALAAYAEAGFSPPSGRGRN